MQTTTFQIPKQLVWAAYEQSKNTKVVGVDGQTILDFTSNRENLLEELWIQLSSGTYVPNPVRRVNVRKKSGGWRPLGIPTVKDFIVQTILTNKLSAQLAGFFHPNSYGHKRSKSARDEAIEMARKRCLRFNWALVLDIKEFGDNIDHQVLMTMLQNHIQDKWVLLYTQRMMQAPAQTKDGTLIESKKGLAHGIKLNFLLGNFFLHHIFDQWMQTKHPGILFERYNDDIICHCKSEITAKRLLSRIQARFGSYKMVTHPLKTKIVYCKDANRKGTYANVSFTFLGSTFRSRRRKSKFGTFISIFSPGVDAK